MKMRIEADVKKRVKEILKEHGAWWFMPVQSGYGVAGVPDFLICYKGQMLAIETKFGGNRPTPLQRRQLDNIEAAGGRTVVVDETNVESVKAWLHACSPE